MSTVQDFFAQHDDWPWNPPRPGRATFHYLIAVTEGELRHDVDHVTRTVAPGQWLWVRPGHAQCWHPPGAALSAARGPFMLFEPDVLRPDIARLLAPLTAHEAPAVLSPHPDDAVWPPLTRATPVERGYVGFVSSDDLPHSTVPAGEGTRSWRPNASARSRSARRRKRRRTRRLAAGSDAGAADPGKHRLTAHNQHLLRALSQPDAPVRALPTQPHPRPGHSPPAESEPGPPRGRNHPWSDSEPG
ncbi:hypothetical protein [Streptomyces soliscabiei]|uniref:hypothetical protein n=1 Tax=Streptomyces soliscabiei TaxID=588897 RepID=UPI0029B88849|nr:hypothetical protein [Streptomyces sp. NY05-11A]MDX2678142.1 hypothetical protein [Streptomyces sp. NY05-11A]